LAVLAFVLRGGGIIEPQKYMLGEHDSFLYTAMHQAIPSPLIQNILCTLLVIIQAIMINRIVLRHRLMITPNYLAAFVYIIMMSLLPDFLMLHPFIIANTFFIFAMTEIVITYKEAKPALHIFNIGFLIGLASWFYLPFLIFYFFFSLALLIMRSYNLIERGQLLFGFITPFWMIGIYLFWQGNLGDVWQSYFLDNLNFPKGLFVMDRTYLISLSLSLLVIVIALFSYGSMIRKKGIQTEKITDILFWIFIFSFLAIFFWQDLSLYHYLFIAFPASVLLGNSMLQIKSVAVSEMLGLALIFIIFGIHFILI